MASFKQDHFHVTNDNPREAAQFYIDCLGAKYVNEVSLADRLIINLDIDGIPYRISNRTGADDKMGGFKPGFHHVALQVDDVGKALEAMKSKKAKIIVEPFFTESGNCDAFIETPDGVVFELIQKKRS